jgi:hypothetical protein
MGLSMTLTYVKRKLSHSLCLRFAEVIVAAGQREHDAARYSVHICARKDSASDYHRAESNPSPTASRSNSARRGV